MWPLFPLVAVMLPNRASNEQNTTISQEPETKECGLDDENAGETLSDRRLVEHGEWDRLPPLDKWDRQIREMCLEWMASENRMPVGVFDDFVEAYNKCRGRG